MTDKLKPGMPADLVVLSGDIEKTSPNKLLAAHTTRNGRVRFSA